MKLILLPGNNVLNSLSHLSNQIGIQLTIEMIPFIFIDALNSTIIFLAKVLFDYPYNGLFHLFLHDVVFARGIDFIEEFLLSLLKGAYSVTFTLSTITLF